MSKIVNLSLICTGNRFIIHCSNYSIAFGFVEKTRTGIRILGIGKGFIAFKPGKDFFNTRRMLDIWQVEPRLEVRRKQLEPVL